MNEHKKTSPLIMGIYVYLFLESLLVPGYLMFSVLDLFKLSTKYPNDTGMGIGLGITFGILLLIFTIPYYFVQLLAVIFAFLKNKLSWLVLIVLQILNFGAFAYLITQAPSNQSQVDAASIFLGLDLTVTVLATLVLIKERDYFKGWFATSL